jgi:hypothetical protein
MTTDTAVTTDTLTTDARTRTTPKGMLWTGRVISAIPVLMMAGMGTFMLVANSEKAVEGMTQYGYPASAGRPILIAMIASAIIYAIPQTAVLGAILLTGYLGGAVATHVHAGEPPSKWIVPVVFGAIVWLGLFLRDARVRALVPFRRR